MSTLVAANSINRRNDQPCVADMGMWFPSFWGDYHTNVRFVIIDVNFVVMLACSIAAFWSKGNGKAMLVIAGILTTILWSVEGAINATV